MPVNVLYLYEKEKERERETSSPKAVRICLFRTRPDAITWRKVPHCYTVYCSTIVYRRHCTSNDNWFHTTNKDIIGGITLEEINIL